MKSKLATIVVLLALLAAISGCGEKPTTPTVSPLPTPPESPPPTPQHAFLVEDPLVVLGMTHLTGLQIQGSETDALVIDQTSTGDIAEFRDNGTVVFRIADGGTVTQVGDGSVTGTTPTLTIGDAGEEDAAIVFDGAAQDFHIGLDDTADDLVVGKGSALGTTTAFSIDENQVTTWVGGTICLAEITTAADTLTASQCGTTIFLNSATEYQTILPAVSTVAAGCEFRFIVKAAPSGASYTVITGNSDEDVLIGGINELEVDTGDDGPYDASADTITFVDGTAVVGDFVYMISDGSFFYVSGQANADGGVTITDSD